MKIQQRKDGLFYYSKMYKGQRYQFTSMDKNEVKKQVIEFENNRLNKSIIIDDNSLSVKQWSDKWLNTYKKNVEKATFNMYKQTIKLYINKYLGNIKLKNIKENDIISMLNKMSEQGITRQKDITLLTIKQILDKAVYNDYVYKNVAKDIKIKKHISVEKEPISDKYIEFISNNLDKDFCRMCYFMIYTGVRREELVPLTYEDVDFKNKTIRINKAVTFQKNQPVLKNTKNNTERYIPLLDNLLPILEKNSIGLIFYNKYGKMMSETSFKRKIEYTNNLIKTNIPNKYKRFTAHQLRHTYACFLHKAGIPLKEAQYFMGHKDIKMLLNIYTHLDNKDKENAKNKLNNFICKTDIRLVNLVSKIV